MKLKSLFSGLVAVAIFSFAAVQVYAVVDQDAEVTASEETEAIMEKIEAIADEAETADSEQTLERIDLALEEIDGLLDEEPANEDELLDIRDGLVAMRIEASANNDFADQPQTFVGTGGAVSGGSYSYGGGGGYCSACASSGGGGGGAVFSGGMNIRRFWPLLGLIALAAIGGDDDAEPVSMPGNGMMNAN